jgi:DNA-binding transcriptional MerR regulator
MMDSSDALFPWEIPDDAASAAVDSRSAAASGAPAPPIRAGGSPLDRAERRDDRTALEAPLRERTVAHKEYYSISEVCDIVGLKPHVLRYWETQFGPLNPSKNRSGNRVYQRKEIKLIMLVKHLLYEEKYTVEGARAKLDHLRRTGKLPEMTGRALAADTAVAIRGELETLLRVLTPSARK